LLCVTGSRSHAASSVVDKPLIDKLNNKQLIQSTLYDQQTPFAAWKSYFPDQCRFNMILIKNIYSI